MITFWIRKEQFQGRKYFLCGYVYLWWSDCDACMYVCVNGRWGRPWKIVRGNNPSMCACIHVYGLLKHNDWKLHVVSSLSFHLEPSILFPPYFSYKKHNARKNALHAAVLFLSRFLICKKKKNSLPFLHFLFRLINLSWYCMALIHFYFRAHTKKDMKVELPSWMDGEKKERDF